MKKIINNIAVIGDGGWGTTLAICLAEKEHPVSLWGPFPDYIKKIRKNRYNSKFLPGIRMPQLITPEESLEKVVCENDLLVFAVPSKFTHDVVKMMKKTKADFSQKTLLSVTKGIDTNNLMRMSEIFQSELTGIDCAVLSGPTIAREVALKIPSSAVIASEKIAIAKKLQPLFNSDSFRIYTNSDVVGVEVGGSIKNIIAIACGLCDGLGFGTNTKAAIVTRGLAEMARLGKELGGREKTFAGLSGIGDLVTTCFSLNSRNRHVGEQLGRGKSIQQVLGPMKMVAEGVETVKAVYKLSAKLGIPMPISHEVYSIIYKNKKPINAVSDLMHREMKAE